MKTYRTTLALCAALAAPVALTGCFGGGGDGDSSGGGGGGNFETVDSQTRYTSDGGLTLSEATNADTTGRNAQLNAECGDSPSDRYLETSKAIVFGDGNASEEQLQSIANAIHNYYPETLESLGLEESSFDTTNRAAIVSRFLEKWGYDWALINDAVTDATGKNPGISNATTANTELLKFTASELKPILEQAHSQASVPETFEDVMAIESAIKGTHQPRYTDETKIVACADTSVEPGNGTAKTWGLTVSEDFKADVLHHELVHYAQARLAGGQLMNDHIPRWFREGQAVVLSGQSVIGENRVDEYNPTTIETYDDAGDDFRSLDNYYGFYGLAYEYVDQETAQEDLNRMFSEVYMGQDQLESSGGNPFAEFQARFDDLALKPDGSDLIYTEYQDDWEALVRDYL